MIGRRVLALALLAVLAVGCGTGGDSGEVGPEAPPASPQTSAAPGSPPQKADEPTVAVPVYYVAEVAPAYRLHREFHRVSSRDPAGDAVREMLASPTGTDPDYRNPWPQGTSLNSAVTTQGGVITVDLTGLGWAQLDAELAEFAVQQLVFTVQGALQSADPVRILVDGRPVDELWGVVEVSEPVERADPYALRSLVQIDEPAHGALVSREVRVSGEAAVFEASVLWEVLRDGSVVRSGATSTSEGQRFAPYAFEVPLEPGDYVVRVMEDDPSGGEGRPVLTDDKTITVG